MLQQVGPWVMNEDDARTIAARVWCDDSMRSLMVDPDVCEQITQVLLKAYGEPQSAAADSGPEQGQWVTFTLHEPAASSPYSDHISVQRAHVIGMQAAPEGGCILHLPSGVVRVKENVHSVSIAISNPGYPPPYLG